eukprot:CAMPEP_0115095158 /NCGR_PEP_ID=MMETSP0227-20121206/28821_1 /TAXON_ID=89957 /ORGANISM="Polarella glacialis, Strain CCMP 1383" /LENGTH=470 /DNA_ID=CAMNT_0002488367 /DNA_START=250 /DNA_END=1662 /DNA_ORIENTATION=+
MMTTRPMITEKTPSSAAPSVPALTSARARALLTELLIGFSAREFQKQMDALARADVATRSGLSPEAAAAITVLPSEIFQLEGRRELALTVQKQVLPRYGFEGSEEGVAKMVRAMHPLLVDARILEQSEAVKRKLRMPSKTALDSDSDDEAAFAAQARGEVQPRRLRRAKALAIQSELLIEYSQPAFQTRLRETRRLHDPEAQRQERKRLIREVQALVLPKFGFEVTDEGIKSMNESFQPWADDAEVQSLISANEEQLTLCIKDVMEKTLAERKGAASSLAGPTRSLCRIPASPTFSPAQRPHGIGQTRQRAYSTSSPPTGMDPALFMLPPSPVAAHSNTVQDIGARSDGSITKEETVQLLRELLAAFSAPNFQQQVQMLRRAAEGSDQKRPGALSLDGIDEIALAVQGQVVSRFGFEGNKEGVMSMIFACSRHIKDIEVSALNDEINERLGKGVQEQKRLRQRLDSLNAN